MTSNARCVMLASTMDGRASDAKLVSPRTMAVGV